MGSLVVLVRTARLGPASGSGDLCPQGWKQAWATAGLEAIRRPWELVRLEGQAGTCSGSTLEPSRIPVGGADDGRHALDLDPGTVEGVTDSGWDVEEYRRCPESLRGIRCGNRLPGFTEDAS